MAQFKSLLLFYKNFFLLFCFYFPFFVTSVHALSTPVSINLNVNKYNMPSQVWIYNGVYGGGPVSQPPEFANLNTLVCQSDTDPQFGACPSRATTTFLGGAGEVILKFCLEGTTTCKNLTLNTWRLDSGQTKTPPWIAVKSDYRNGVFFYYSINKNQLSLLSTGIWKARLVLSLVQWKPGPVALDGWVADISLNVIADAHPMIFFPKFISGKPVVSFDFSHAVNPVNAKVDLDMCLYDGGTKSSTVSISMNDDNSTGQYDFYMVRNGGSIDNDSDKIKYNVRVTQPITGEEVAMSNNHMPLIIYNADAQSAQQLVFIPGVGTVSCLPFKVKLLVRNLNISEKISGFYNDTLKILYTPATSSG